METDDNREEELMREAEEALIFRLSEEVIKFAELLKNRKLENKEAVPAEKKMEDMLGALMDEYIHNKIGSKTISKESRDLYLMDIFKKLEGKRPDLKEELKLIFGDRAYLNANLE